MADDRLEYQITAKDEVTPVLKRINKGFGDTEKSAGKMGASMVAAGNLMADAAKSAMSAIVDLGKATMQEADDFRKFGATVGMNAAEVAGLDRVFSLAGSSTEGLKSAMLSLSAALDPEKVTKQRTAVEQLGVSVTNSDGTMKTHRQLLLDIADVYNKETSEVRKAAIGKRIFGAESQKLNEILGMGSAELERQSKLYGDASGYSQDLAANYESFNDALTKVEISLKGVLASISDSTIFKSAIKYISDLSDEWVQFLADIKTEDANKKTQALSQSLDDLGARYKKIYERQAGGLPVEHDLRKADELAQSAMLNGAKASELYLEQQVAIGKVLEAEKDRGASGERIDRLQQEFNLTSKKRKLALEEEARATDAAAKKERERLAIDNAPKEKKKKEDAAKPREFAFQKEMASIEERNRRTAEKAKDDARKSELEWEATMAEIRKSKMSDTDRERVEAREWYEEKKKIVGDDAELQEAYTMRLAEIDTARREEEMKHQEEARQAEMARFQVQQDMAAAMFQFLHTATDGYKSLGAAAKAVALAEAWWNTYVAFTKALSQYGPIAGPVMGALALAQGAAMTAKIQSQKFADGGIVDSMAQYGDTNQVYANGGELFINRQQQSDLYNWISGRTNTIDKLRERNTGTGSKIEINVNGMMVDNKTVRRLERAITNAQTRS